MSVNQYTRGELVRLAGRHPVNDTLDSVEEIQANTQENKLAGALAVKAINTRLGGLTFAPDAEGNWGYIPYGADTVIPFKSGGIDIENPKATLSGTLTSVTCNDCTIGKTYIVIYAPWSSGGSSQAQSYLSISSYSGCTEPEMLYKLSDNHHSVVGVFKTESTSETFKIQWHTGGGGYIIVTG